MYFFQFHLPTVSCVIFDTPKLAMKSNNLILKKKIDEIKKRKGKFPSLIICHFVKDINIRIFNLANIFISFNPATQRGKSNVKTTAKIVGIACTTDEYLAFKAFIWFAGLFI